MALVVLYGTVTEAGTVTAALLLARLTTEPPQGAAPFRVTVQASVPALVIDDELHVTELGIGIPVPLMLTVALPVEELLAMVRVPVKLLPPLGLNDRLSVAVWPALRVNGVVTPDAPNKDPTTERLEIVTGLVPVEVSVMAFVPD